MIGNLRAGMFEPLSGSRISECPFEICFLDKLGLEHNLVYRYGGIADLSSYLFLLNILETILAVTLNLHCGWDLVKAIIRM